MRQLFDRLCQEVHALTKDPCGTTDEQEQQQLGCRWEVQCTQQQAAQLFPLAAEVRELCLMHESAADVLVQTAVGLGGGRLQYVLGALEAVGESLLADFLRAAVYSDRLMQPCEALEPADSHPQHAQARKAAESDIEQQDAWLQSAYSAVLAEDASSIAVPHVFGRMVIRKRSRQAKVDRPTLAGTFAAPSAVLCAGDEVPAMLSSVASTVDARSEVQRYETLLGSLQANAGYAGGAAAATEAQTDVPAATEQRHVGKTGRSGFACIPGHDTLDGSGTQHNTCCRAAPSGRAALRDAEAALHREPSGDDELESVLLLKSLVEAEWES
ncbi:hypothetical protein D9Q98_002432 [Chlorella vulgaris]|uniref:Uncharacterized protein n=1 Tax=Chlorella vulgaris TaxID=3077 RepID=A0A9D4Z094_CHLVU|nr:hypothetical protein D9Q98_002432 [Chlorella vulgaris]